MSETNFSVSVTEISARLAAKAADVAEYLLPKGKRFKSEWKVGSIGGEPGQSLSVRIGGHKAGIWSDFSTGQAGDLLDLWMEVRGLSISQAIHEAKSYLGIVDPIPERPVRAYKRPDRPKGQAAKDAVRTWLRGRGLTDDTIGQFKIAEQTCDGKVYAIFPYLRDGELVNVKYRNIAEKRDMRQESGAEPCLFGWHLIEPRARRVAIAEGEIDAMTLHQVGIPALSVNAGAGNFQWLENDWDRLQRFSEILICFDHDEAGDKGAAEVMRRLGDERCKRVKLAAKDANEYLTGGASAADFYAAVRDAKPQDPDELKSAIEFIGRVKSLFYPAAREQRDPVLMLDAALDWFEFRGGELTVWTGFNGHGKSLLLSQVMLGLMRQGERVVVFSGEMTPERQLKRMVKQATGLDKPTPEYIDAVGAWLTDRLWLFNLIGSAKLERLVEVFAYANRRYGVRQFVIDSLMMTDIPEDGAGAFTAQKRAIQLICDFAKRAGVHVHLVAHPRKGVDESKGPGKMDVAGSSKITDGADNVFSVWAKRKDESAPPEPGATDAKLELFKQRNGDVQHRQLWLFFDRASMQFRTSSRAKTVRYIPLDVEADEVPL